MSDAYIIMGHAREPEVTLEDEQNFVPCSCKIKARQKDVTIGTRTNNGFMDFTSFFVVPDNCIIVVKSKPGELSHSSVVHPLLNKIGAAENQELYRNPLSNTKEIINQLGPVSIYKPGDICPNFVYTLFFDKGDIQATKKFIVSHLGLYKTPLTNPITMRPYDHTNTILKTTDEIYSESVFPKKETIQTVLRSVLRKEPTDFKDMLAIDKADCGKLTDYVQGYLSVTQKQLLKIGDDGIAKRPGVFYNFACRYVPDSYYKRLAYNHMDKVNPAISSILTQPNTTQRLFNRVLSETLKQRKPYVRNSYTGGKRKRTRKNK